MHTHELVKIVPIKRLLLSSDYHNDSVVLLTQFSYGIPRNVINPSFFTMMLSINQSESILWDSLSSLKLM